MILGDTRRITVSNAHMNTIIITLSSISYVDKMSYQIPEVLSFEMLKHINK